MGKKKIVGVCGGDPRTDYIKLSLEKKGYEICDGFSDPLFYQKAEQCDAVLLPAPLTADGESFFAPCFEKKFAIKDFLRQIPKDTPLFCGRAKRQDIEKIRMDGHNIYNCYADEAFLIENGILTAEGAIQLAISHTKESLWNSKILVLGYGRVAKPLCKRLGVLCRERVKVYARRSEQRAEIMRDGLSETADFKGDFDNFNIVFNTIPSMICDENLLKKANKNCLIIDLASSPGGVDFEAAKRLGVGAVSALSLPSKTSPAAAAELFVNTCLSRLSEVSVNAVS